MPLKVEITDREMRDRLATQLAIAKDQAAAMAREIKEGHRTTVHAKALLAASRGNIRDLSGIISKWDKANLIPKRARGNRRRGGGGAVEGQGGDRVAEPSPGGKPARLARDKLDGRGAKAKG